jgi:hypothetical protein
VNDDGKVHVSSAAKTHIHWRCCAGGVGGTTRASRLSQAVTASQPSGSSPGRAPTLSRAGAAALAATDGMNSGRQSLVGEEGVSLFVHTSRDGRMSGMGGPTRGSHSGAAPGPAGNTSGGIGSHGGRGQSTSRPSSAGSAGERLMRAGNSMQQGNAFHI